MLHNKVKDGRRVNFILDFMVKRSTYHTALISILRSRLSS
jgi:hypothetical protein